MLLLALLGGYPLPLAAVQMLWINIVTEGTLTVNLVMDPPDGDEMQRAPLPRADPLFDRGMLWRDGADDTAGRGGDVRLVRVAQRRRRADRRWCRPRPSRCW